MLYSKKHTTDNFLLHLMIINYYDIQYFTRLFW